MTLKIEKYSDGQNTIIRLIGRMQSEHLEELRGQIKNSGSRIALDLEEVNLVDVEVVRFLGTCQGEGVGLLHCSAYITDWIAKEHGREK
jgi:anti-anti-sigma regulatory factor